MPLPVGDRLGPYEILAPIGAGGMGNVYKARDTRLDRIVAIKVSKTEFSERFEREARAVAALNHSNICQIYDVGPNYLVMEYIEGTPLKGPLPLDQALKYAAQICDALDAAHKKGITHRDLKPANILVTKAGSIRTLQWIRSDGAGEAQQLLESKTDLRPYSFSPDGKRVAFGESRAETGFDLWTLPLDLSDPEHPKAGKPEAFLRTMYDESEPAFSPDGRWIAYRSFELARNEVYVRPFPGPGGKWLISTGGGRHPVWSRNGRELFYQGQDSRIMVATYSAKGDSFAADKPRPWAQTQILDPNALNWNLDLAPDGKRFVVAPRPEATGGQKGSVRVTVLLNFFDDLRRRVPAGK